METRDQAGASEAPPGGAAIVVGGGHAAGELSVALRQEGWTGDIIVVGEEPHLPYQRPPLSKAFLAGEVELESLMLRPPATYEKAGVRFETGVRVDTLDRAARTVQLSDGRSLSYAKLALATGGRPRRLALADMGIVEAMPNFHYLRTVADVVRLRPQFQPGMRLVIIGAGYVGLEVAAVAVKRGLKVTVLEAMDRVLSRVTAPEISAFYEQLHRDAGVDLRTNVQVERFEFDASGDALGAVLCRDGSRLQADLVIAGVGLVPNTELAEAAGLAVDNGITVDQYCRTSDPHIVAAGDCTNHPSAYAGRRLRLESVPNAVEQGRTAAAALCGRQRAYDAVPWFWSDQYGLKLQMVGLSQGYDRLLLRGQPATRSFAAFYLQGDRLLAADAVNRPQEFMLAKRLVTARCPVDPALLVDETVPLKTLLAALPA